MLKFIENLAELSQEELDNMKVPVPPARVKDAQAIAHNVGVTMTQETVDKLAALPQNDWVALPPGSNKHGISWIVKDTPENRRLLQRAAHMRLAEAALKSVIGLD